MYLADHRVKLKGSEKRDKYQDLSRELKKLWNMKVKVIPIVIGALGTITKGLVKGLGELEMNYTIIKIDQNAEKSLGDLRRLAATQILVEDHQQISQIIIIIRKH